MGAILLNGGSEDRYAAKLGQKSHSLRIDGLVDLLSASPQKRLDVLHKYRCDEKGIAVERVAQHFELNSHCVLTDAGRGGPI